MRVDQLLANNQQSGIKQLLVTLKTECADFISESRSLPVYKQLPAIYESFQKVKVRKHKRNNQFNNTFNEAFVDEMKDLRQRSVFASGERVTPDPDKELFYIFPINGYRYMYCTEVQHSSADYKQVFESIFDNVEDPEQVIHDLLKFSYVREQLHEGIEKHAELIFYNMPYYYSVRTTLYEEYDMLLTDIANMEDNP